MQVDLKSQPHFCMSLHTSHCLEIVWESYGESLGNGHQHTLENLIFHKSWATLFTETQTQAHPTHLCIKAVLSLTQSTGGDQVAQA